MKTKDLRRKSDRLLGLTVLNRASGTLVGKIEGSAVIDLGIGDPFPLPGVTTTLTYVGHKRERRLLTNEEGEFLFQNLPLGDYLVKAHRDGFRVMNKGEIKVRVNVDRTKSVLPPFRMVPIASMKMDMVDRH